MWKLLIELFFLYLIYKIVFDFIIPVYKASKQMSQKMQDFSQKMNVQQKPTGNQPTQNSNTGTRHKPKDEDYIDFEEIK